MVRLTSVNCSGGGLESLPLAIGLFVSVSVLVGLCAKHASRVSKKIASGQTNNSKIAPKSPLPSPKKLLTTITNKAIPFIHKKRIAEESESAFGEVADEGFGDGGLWQRAILMGEKCQPHNFSGVIYYDDTGKQLSELPPRSPRVTPLPSFSFPVAIDRN